CRFLDVALQHIIEQFADQNLLGLTGMQLTARLFCKQLIAQIDGVALPRRFAGLENRLAVDIHLYSPDVSAHADRTCSLCLRHLALVFLDPRVQIALVKMYPTTDTNDRQFSLKDQMLDSLFAA